MPSSDEYYTRLTDIEAELKHYDFTGKSICCPCDSPLSAFYQYFTSPAMLPKIMSADFVWLNGQHIHCNNSNCETYELKEDGDFRNYETEDLMDECDITISNPPFSLMSPFLGQLIDLNADFLVVAPPEAINIIKVRREILNGRIRAGNRLAKFTRPDGSEGTASAIWLTNLERPVHKPIELKCVYSEDDYPFYDQAEVEAIHISKVENIPKDYSGIMSVPLTFMAKYNPAQFTIVDFSREITQKLTLGGKEIRPRIFIQRR